VQVNIALVNDISQRFAEGIVESAQNMIVANQQVSLGAEFSQNASQFDSNVACTNNNGLPKKSVKLHFERLRLLWQFLELEKSVTVRSVLRAWDLVFGNMRITYKKNVLK
jgi:ribosome-associated toxin RatA of RatAB toxin-antitoxin module